MAIFWLVCNHKIDPKELDKLHKILQPGDKIISCHPPINIIKGDTTFLEALHEKFGADYNTVAVKAENFDQYLQRLSGYRMRASVMCDAMVVLGSEIITSVAAEIKIYTDKHFIIL